jgi:hypothetical protein
LIHERIGRRLMKEKETQLHILKSEPDEIQKTLMNTLAMESECLFFPLFDDKENIDYEKLIDLILKYDKIITWW